MALKRLDCAGDSTTTTGTGPYVLAGDPAQGFVAIKDHADLSDGDTLRLRLQNHVEGSPELSNVDFITALFTWDATAKTVTTGTIYESSNGGAAVSFTGTTLVFNVQTATDFEVFSNVDGGNFSSNYGGTTGVDGGTF